MMMTFLRHLPARLAGDAAGRDQLRRDGADIVQKQAMPCRLKVAGHWPPHGAEADETDVGHIRHS
jgi:hypothetical protein